ncbi:MAG: hypothetical protein ACLT38_00040 [Akkermansia sp.]
MAFRQTEHARLRTQDSSCGRLVLTGADKHNLNNVTLNIPVGTLTCISGPSGSGNPPLSGTVSSRGQASPFREKGYSAPRAGTEHFNRLVVIDQSPIGKTPRSTPATATGLLQVLRPLYAQLPLSKQRGYTAARFSPIFAEAVVNGARERA